MGEFGEEPKFENRFVPKSKGRVIPQSVVMYLGGTRSAFHGWEDLTIKKDLEQLATTFSFKIPQSFREANKTFKLAPQTRVQINVNEQPVITGRIETLNSSLSSEENSITVSGRSLTGDLVDCAVVGPMEYVNISLDKLARELIKPFGLKVFLSANPKVISKVSIKPGDKVFEVLDKYARGQGLFWVTTREGNLRLAFPGNSKSDSRIEEHVNLKSGSVNIDETQRFAKYIVRGQSSADDDFPGVVAGTPEATALDNGVNRYRPTIDIAEGNLTQELAKSRAQWEAGYKLARCFQILVTVQGWQQETGILWGLNQLTPVVSETLGLNGIFLSNSVEHIRSRSEGTVTRIGLTLKNAYSISPAIPKGASDDLQGIVDFSKKNPAVTE